jgi:hypothetical protein
MCVTWEHLLSENQSKSICLKLYRDVETSTVRILILRDRDAGCLAGYRPTLCEPCQRHITYKWNASNIQTTESSLADIS